MLATIYQLYLTQGKEDKNCGIVFSYRDGVDLRILGPVTAGTEAVGFWSTHASPTATMLNGWVWLNKIITLINLGENHFTPLNYHKSPIFNLQLQKQITEVIQLSKPGKFAPQGGLKGGFSFFEN